MLVVLGLDPNYRVPRFAAQIVYGAGNVSAASLAEVVLCAGMKTSAGTMVVEADIVFVQTEEDVDIAAGPGSQLARMGYKAVRVPLARVYLIAIAEPGSAVAATVTLVLSGTWTVAGSWGLRLAGEFISAGILAGDVIDSVGTAMAAEINKRTRLPFTAAWVGSSTNTLTITVKNVGTQGMKWRCWFDKSHIPSGLGYTLTGSGSLGNTDRVSFGVTAGTGVESATNALTKLTTRRYARIAVASTDGTNAAAWLTQTTSKATATVLLLDQLIFASTDIQSTATTLAQTTLNAPRAMVAWMRNSESHPCEIAAFVAAVRSVTEGESPVPDYDNYQLDEIVGVQPGYESDSPTDTEQNNALNSGLTPIKSVDGKAFVVSAITSYCHVPGSVSEQDTRCFDIGDAVFPDFAVLDSKLLYETDFRPANKYVGPDPGATDPEPPPNVGTPRVWNALLYNRMRGWFDQGWIEDPADNPPFSEFNSVSKRIMTLMPLLVRRVQHQLGLIARQTANQ